MCACNNVCQDSTIGRRPNQWNSLFKSPKNESMAFSNYGPITCERAPNWLAKNNKCINTPLPASGKGGAMEEVSQNQPFRLIFLPPFCLMITCHQFLFSSPEQSRNPKTPKQTKARAQKLSKLKWLKASHLKQHADW